MTEDQRTYEIAADRIEAIIKRLDSGEAGLRETLDLVKEGRELVEWCAAELEAVGQGLEELRLDELVERLGRSERAGTEGTGERPPERSTGTPAVAPDPLPGGSDASER
jgi:exodeoxyribonuclease VII small subunit